VKISSEYVYKSNIKIIVIFYNNNNVGVQCHLIHTFLTADWQFTKKSTTELSRAENHLVFGKMRSKSVEFLKTIQQAIEKMCTILINLNC